MNLLSHQWIPVLTHSGVRRWIAPSQLASSDLAVFDADRADFNGALAQFAIGLLQTASPVNSNIEWRALLKSPPTEATLNAWFSPLASAFEFDGEGARFMQDFELRAGDGEAVPVAGLLIEAPGENATKNNTDHFVKRNGVNGLCPCCAALALFTLQLNAPAGGKGNRTGVRGGGPLTTLLAAQNTASTPLSLWHSLWLNVQARPSFEAHGGRAELQSPHHTFPWMARIEALQKPEGELAPAQVHPAHVFWAMPRRIRLDLDAPTGGHCGVCQRETSSLVRQYVTRNYGLNYKGPWSHPLSPYYEGKEGMLPVHPQPDGLGYRHWLGWVLGMQSDKRKVARAKVIDNFLQSGLERKTGMGLRIWAFGYDMDNMKARGWYDATVPIYALADCSQEEQRALRDDVSAWLAGAELAASYLRGAVKDAWFSHDARGDFGVVDASFWSNTERAFYELLGSRIKAAANAMASSSSPSSAFSEPWLAVLQRTALHLFESHFVGTGPIERQNPARIARAHHQLQASLRGPKLRAALALPVENKPQKAGKAKAAAQAQEDA